MNDFLGKQLEKWRIHVVFPLVQGKLLDIGCGNNRLVRKYGNGIGVDVFNWGDIDLLVSDTSELPFKDEEFDTVTIVAALNHIPNRYAVLKECSRILKRGGQCIITMLPPLLSKVWHRLRGTLDADQRKRGMREGEVYGLTKGEIIDLLSKNGFILIKYSRFMLGINSLFLFQKGR